MLDSDMDNEAGGRAHRLMLEITRDTERRYTGHVIDESGEIFAFWGSLELLKILDEHLP